jgi:1,4-alpha-glucan branching enzyme
MATCATHAFLPFIGHNQESLQAQMETPNLTYRRHFGGIPQGFWLPELGWTAAIEPYLRAYNFTYTIVDSHGLLLGSPLPAKGCFYPAKTPNGTFLLARDLYAVRDIEKMTADDLYRNNDRDAGYELSSEIVSRFLGAEGGRSRTGYTYWTKSDNGQNIYNPQTASNRVIEHTKTFLENTIARLEEASKYMEETPISLYANNADNFGRFWHEGPQFIETLFRMACEYKGLQFVCPSEYIFKQNISSFQVVSPEFSSSGFNGYAETWLNVSNDWIYRHLYRAMERMTELAERFPDDTGLKERALNQAAREILLAQSSDWPSLLYKQDSTEFARNNAENSLRNFTTIYEALGSNYLSTEWLTTLERKHNIFPNINYRVFRRKK